MKNTLKSYTEELAGEHLFSIHNGPSPKDWVLTVIHIVDTFTASNSNANVMKDQGLDIVSLCHLLYDLIHTGFLECGMS